MIKLNSDKGRKIVSNYISALNGDSEAIEWAYDKRKAEYDTYDDDLKAAVDKCFDCIQCVTEGEKVKDSVAETTLLSHLLNINNTHGYTICFAYHTIIYYYHY